MTRYPDETVQRIKTLVRLSDLVGRTVRLRRVGKDFRGLSPFSNEKTPSFYVHDDRGFYKCFSTQKAGDCFTWLTETQGQTFTEAVEQLAAEVGVELRTASPAENAAAAERARILQALEFAQQYFVRALFWSDAPAAAAARYYMTARGLSAKLCSENGIGWAPPGDQLRVAAAKAGHSVEALVGAGLLRRYDDGSVRTFFRDRITLPVHDLQGRPIGFTARAMGDDVQPKYLNTAETPVFTKGNALFGIHQARQMLAKAPPLYIVEGCFDVVTMRLHGLAAAAPLGTAMTAQQLEMAWRCHESPILCFDGDAAGHRAAMRSAERGMAALRAGRSLRFVIMPTGQDPDSLLRAGKAMPGAVSHFQLVWDNCAAGLALGDPSDRGMLRERIKPLLESMIDRDSRKEWAAAFAHRMAQQSDAAPRPAAVPRDQVVRTTREARAERAALPEPDATAMILLLAVAGDPERVEAHIETLAGLPCGRFDPVRDWLTSQDAGQADALTPAVQALLADMRARRPFPVIYKAVGWERVARALQARYAMP